MSRSFHLFVLLAFSVTSSALFAQTQSGPISLDLGVGASFGRGGGIRDARDGLAASAVVAWPVSTTQAGRPLVALSGAVQRPIAGHGDRCLSTPGGGCASDYPRIEAIGLLGGWEVGREPTGLAVRALLGPALFHSEEGAAAGGLQGRVDVTSPAVAHLSLVAWGQGGVVPRLRGERYRLGAFGLGLRVR